MNQEIHSRAEGDVTAPVTAPAERG
jgi:hypothetical protein